MLLSGCPSGPCNNCLLLSLGTEASRASAPALESGRGFSRPSQILREMLWERGGDLDSLQAAIILNQYNFYTAHEHLILKSKYISVKRALSDLYNSLSHTAPISLNPITVNYQYHETLSSKGKVLNKRQNPSGFFLLLKTKGFCFSNLAGTIKFKCERKSEKVSGRSSKMTSSCKRPIHPRQF